MDAAMSKDERPWRGRRSRVVLAPRCWRQVGEDAPASRRWRGQESPVPGKSTKETVNTIAQGMPVIRPYLWW